MLHKILPKLNASKKKFIIFGGLAVIVVGLMFLRQGKKSSLATNKVARGSVVNVVDVSGNVDSSSKIDVFSETDGMLMELYVKNGDMVVEGQEMFKVKSSASEGEKVSAQAKYLASVQARQASQQGKLLVQSQLEDARRAVLGAADSHDNLDYEMTHGAVNSVTDRDFSQNYKDISSSSLVSTRQYFDKVEKEYLEYDTKIAAAYKDEEAKKIAYDATLDQVVKSPVSGTINNIVPLVGDAVSAKRPEGKGEPVLSLSNFNNFTVTVPVKESDIYKVKLGQKARVTLDVIDDVEFEGEVIRVDGIGEKISGVVTFNVVLALTGGDERIRPGMSALANIETEKKDNVLLIENSAIRKGEDGKYVVVERGEKREEISVVLGLKGSEFTEVVSGLEEGDVVVIPDVTSGASIGIK